MLLICEYRDIRNFYYEASCILLSLNVGKWNIDAVWNLLQVKLLIRDFDIHKIPNTRLVIIKVNY